MSADAKGLIATGLALPILIQYLFNGKNSGHIKQWQSCSDFPTYIKKDLIFAQQK